MKTPAERVADMEHYVYGCYNAAGEVVYIGFTYNLPARLRTHHGRRSWMPDVTKVEILATAPTRIEGEREEERLIAKLRPAYNKRIPTPESEWDLDLCLRQIEADCMMIDRVLWPLDMFPVSSRTLVARVLKRFGVALPTTGRQALLDAARGLRTTREPVDRAA